MFYIVLFGLSVIIGSLLHKFWWGVATGLIIDLCLFLLLQYGPTLKAWAKRRKEARTKEQPASSTTPAGKPAEKKSYGKLIGWAIALAVIGWSWYSIENKIGFPGTYVAMKSYDHTMPLVLPSLQDQKFCGIEPGKWRFEFPQQAAWEQVARHRKMEKAGFYIRTPRGDIEHLSAVSNIMVNNTFSGKEKVTVGPDGCVTVSVFTSPEGKTRAEMLGAPIINGVHLVPGRESIPQSFTVLIRFY